MEKQQTTNQSPKTPSVNKSTGIKKNRINNANEEVTLDCASQSYPEVLSVFKNCKLRYFSFELLKQHEHQIHHSNRKQLTELVS